LPFGGKIPKIVDNLKLSTVMPPGFKPQELATRYNVENFQEDEWHTYCGNKSSQLVARQLASCKSHPRLLLNAGSGVYQIGLDGWSEIAVDLFDAPIHGRQNAVRASVEDLPFDPGNFGAVVCVGEVLGYCDPAKAIPEFSRVLAPSGILICDFGNSRSFRYLLKKQYGRAADLITDQYNGTPEPIWVYDFAYINSLLISAKFSIKHISGIHTWSAMARRIGMSAQKATNLQRCLDWLYLPAKWADITAIVAVRGGGGKGPP
jgi:SAM-dependent methyltransferase